MNVLHHLMYVCAPLKNVSGAYGKHQFLGTGVAMIVGHHVDAGNSHTPTTIEFIYFFSKYIGW